MVARVSRAMKGSIQVAMEPHGVHAGQNFILEQLWERDGSTPGEIAEAIGVEGPTVVRALQRMEAAGLVTRKRHATDRRQTTIHLTAAGAKLRTQIPRALKVVEWRALAKFTTAEKKALFTLLERLEANLR